jgi:hypothetical protein
MLFDVLNKPANQRSLRSVLSAARFVSISRADGALVVSLWVQKSDVKRLKTLALACVAVDDADGVNSVHLLMATQTNPYVERLAYINAGEAFVKKVDSGGTCSLPNCIGN